MFSPVLWCHPAAVPAFQQQQNNLQIVHFQGHRGEVLAVNGTGKHVDSRFLSLPLDLHAARNIQILPCVSPSSFPSPPLPLPQRNLEKTPNVSCLKHCRYVEELEGVSKSFQWVGGLGWLWDVALANSQKQNTRPRGEVGKERKPDTRSPEECEREQETQGRICTDGFPAQGNKTEWYETPRWNQKWCESRGKQEPSAAAQTALRAGGMGSPQTSPARDVSRRR